MILIDSQSVATTVSYINDRALLVGEEILPIRRCNGRPVIPYDRIVAAPAVDVALKQISTPVVFCGDPIPIINKCSSTVTR